MIRDKPAFVRALFNRIAPRYDLMNAVMTFGQHQHLRRAAARLALPPRDGLALDLATGTGDFAAALHAVEPSCRVVGVDFAQAMMRLGQAKYRDVAFTTGDALRLPLPDSKFDCAVNAFVLRNVADVRALFAEMFRVLKPNGRAVSLEITSPRMPVWRNIYSLYFDHAMPLVGGIVSGKPDAYRYLPRSVRSLPPPEQIAEWMGAVGFRKIFFQRWACGAMAVYGGVK